MKKSVGIFLLIGACTESAPRVGTNEYTIKEATEAAAEKMRDPGSAQFSRVRVSETGAVCGKVNGKNAYGAYSGAISFLYVPLTSPQSDLEHGEFGAFLEGEDTSYPSPQGLQTTDFATLYSQHCLGISREQLAREKAEFMNKFGGR
jgi:hypothetical protein